MSNLISSRGWNSVSTTISSGFLPVGPEQTMGAGGNLPSGRIPNRIRQTKQRHPWYFEPRWRPALPLTPEQQEATGRKSGAWVIYVTPGFVNGMAPAIWMPAGLIPADAFVWGNKYGETDNPQGEDARMQVLLTDEFTPYLRPTSFIDCTRTYYEGGMYHPGQYPMFFKYMRVQAPEQLDGAETFFNQLAEADKGASIPGIDTGEPIGSSKIILDILAGNKELPGVVFDPDEKFNYGPRQLFSCDVVLKVERPKRVQQFETDEFGILRLAGFTVEAPQQTDYHATLYTIARWFPPELGSWAELMMGLLPPDPGFDEQVIGRIYFLSPDIPDNPGSPDGSWVAFPDHTVFWNINYASQQIIDPFHPDRSLDYFKQIGAVLAGGTAFLIIGSYADMIEVQYDTWANANNQTDMSGYFWNG